jgi:ABC-type antimicrobial peptide transport system permease subunit
LRDTSVAFSPVSLSTATTFERRRRWRLRAPVAVAVARLRARPGRSLLVVAGVAAATALLAGVLGGGLAARDRALQRSLAALSPQARSFQVSSYDLPFGKTYAQADRSARAALALVTPQRPRAATFFPTLRIDRQLVNLGGLDDPQSALRLVAGRWPAECRPARCEVVQVGSGSTPRLDEGGIHLVRVGYARPASTALGLTRTAPPLLLASSAAAFEHLPAFVGISRNHLWTAPLDPSGVHVWQVSRILADESAAQALLAAAGGDTYTLTGADASLQDAQRDGRVSSQRMVLVGGEISALLLGFALVAAVGLRRGVWNEARRLSQRGARRGQVWLAVATEVGTMTIAGVVLGLVLGVAAVAIVAESTSLPAGLILDHSLLTSLGAAIAAGAWIVATVAIAVAVRAPERRRARGLRPIDVAALGALVAIVLAVTSTNASAGVESSRSRLLYTLLPGLVCFVAAVAAGRLLGPAMRLGERWTRSAAAALHLAFLALARAPARTVATVGFLIVSIGLALFAASYRATLEDGARDEAAFAVPLDYTVGEGPQLVLPLDAAPLSRYRQIPGVSAYPVLRRTATVAGAGTSALAPTVLGIPAAAMAKLHWRSDFSSLSPPSLSALIGAGGPVSLRGIPIPAGTEGVGLDVRVKGVPVQLGLVVADADGRLHTVRLGSRGPGAWHLTARMPTWARQLIALDTSLEANQAHQLVHREAGEDNTFNPVGSAALGSLTTSAGKTITDWHGLVTTSNGSLQKGLLTYAFTLDQSIVARLPQPTDGHPLPAVVSSNLARLSPPGSVITLDFQGAEVPARVVGVASRFPDSQDLGQGFVVVDESRLATALGADAPGTSEPDELWLSGPASAEAELGRPPFASLQLASRRDMRSQLASQPLARGITVTLGAAGIVALLLAAVGVWVTLVSDARDERGELFDLEAQGVAPGTLRNQLRLRSIVLLAFGIVGGLVLGLVLSRLVVSVVSVSAETTTPVPPLLTDPAWRTVAVALVLVAALVLVLTELTVRHALRGQTPSRGAWTLE